MNQLTKYWEKKINYPMSKGTGFYWLNGKSRRVWSSPFFYEKAMPIWANATSLADLDRKTSPIVEG